MIVWPDESGFEAGFDKALEGGSLILRRSATSC
jgi:hypothetical protein